MIHSLRKYRYNLVTKLFILFVLINLAGCGTILHPERKGQVDGKIDPSIVLLDGLGLLLYFIPGVIAFAVDFSNGTIYLPGGQASSMKPEELDKLRSLEGQEHIDEAVEIVREKTEGKIDMDSKAVHVSTIKSNYQMASDKIGFVIIN